MHACMYACMYVYMVVWLDMVKGWQEFCASSLARYTACPAPVLPHVRGREGHFANESADLVAKLAAPCKIPL